MKNPNMNYGKELKKLREKEQVTQEQLANSVSIARTTVNHIERGRRKPSEKLFARLLGSMGYEVKKKISKISVTK